MGSMRGRGRPVTDASGNGNNGTISNTTWATTGKYGKALQFNGTKLAGHDPRTRIAAPDQRDDARGVGRPVDGQRQLARRDLQGQRQLLPGGDLDATGRIPTAGMIAGGSYADAFGTAKLTANTWAFLTETYDGSTLRLYVNGTQVASTAHTGAIATSTNPLQIGGDSLYGQFFAGMIDNVRVYNVALTAAQIQTDEATSVNPQGPDTTPPSQPGTLTATADLGLRGRSVVGRLDRQRRRHRLRRRALLRAPAAPASPRSQPPTGTTYKDTRVSAVDELQLPRPRVRRRRQPERLLQHRQRDHADARHHASVAARDADRERDLEPRGRSLVGRLDRQRRRHRLRRRALLRAPAAPTSPRSAPRRTGTTYKDTDVSAVDELQLPRPRVRRRRQPERLLEHRQRHHTGRARRVWWRRMGSMRGRGRRSPTRPGTATTARSATRPGRRPASTARRLQFNGTKLAGHDPRTPRRCICRAG